MSKRHNRISLVVVVALALLASAVPAVAGQSIERPIKEKLSGYSVDIHFPPDEGQCRVPSLWVSTSAGTGVVSHLGQVTWVERHCFQESGTSSDVEVVITAANGDQLFATSPEV